MARPASSSEQHTRLVRGRSEAAAEELPPEILEVVSLVAEILLDQRRQRLEPLQGGLSNQGLINGRGDEGKAA